MSNLEQNIKNSFMEVRKEIIEIKDQILKLAEQQEKLEVLIDEAKQPKKKVVKNGKKN